MRRGYVESVEFDPSGRMVAYRIREGAAWLWDKVTGREVKMVPATTSNVTFSADGRWVCVGTPGGAVQ